MAKLSRRRFLAAAGATAAAAPFIPSLEAFAEGGIPPRMLVFTLPHFQTRYGWKPSGGTTDFELAEIMTPLLPHRDRLLIPTGLQDTAAAGEGSLTELHPHVTSSFGVFTGRAAVPGPNRGSTTGPSFDQLIAARIGADTRFQSLQFGVNSGSFSVCATDAASPLLMENDPAKQFERIFAGYDPDSTGPSPEALRRARQRKSVLDFVSGNLSDVTSRVGARDRERLDAHLSAIRDLERSLEAPTSTAACVVPEPAGAFDVASQSSWLTVGPRQVQLAVAALACDQTRVATVQWGDHGGGVTADWVGSTEDWHHHAHRAAGTEPTENTALFIATAQWVAERFNDALTALQAIDVGDGTLLDHTLVAWIAPPGHGNGEVAYLLAGGERLGMQTGRSMHVEGGRSNELILALMHRMGLEDVESFGDPGHCDGPLAGI